MILNQENFIQLCKEYLSKKDEILELGIAVDTYQFTLKTQVQNEAGTYIEAQQAAYIYRDFATNEEKRQELNTKTEELQPLEDELTYFLQAIAPKGIQVRYESSGRVETLRFENGIIMIGELY